VSLPRFVQLLHFTFVLSLSTFYNILKFTFQMVSG